MRPLDPRLLRYAHAARPYVALTGGLGVATAGLAVAQAFLLGGVISSVVAGASAGSQTTPLAWLAAVVLARALVVWVQERYGERAAVAVVADLRHQVTGRAVALGPAYLGAATRTSVTTLVTDGLEALRPYLSKYLPQLLMTALVTPALLAVVLTQDLVSAATIAVTIPLVPVFMALVGWMTQATAARRLVTMQRLGSQVLDLLAGLPTLVALGRERGPAARVRELGEAHRKATTATLRTAFLSALVLELLTTLSVALVAVGVGLRLLSGHLDFRTALVVLILAPEVYLPLRQVGAQFHASTDGLAAADAAFAVLDRAVPVTGSQAAPDLRHATVEVRGVRVDHPGRRDPAPSDASLTLRPGTVTALVGSSGCGKSTLAEVVLGLRAPDAGSVTVVGPDGERTDLADVDRRAWLDQCAWLGQQPLVVPGSLRENVTLFDPLDHEELEAAAGRAGLGEVVAALPRGWDTRVGTGGVGLSAGQRQRLALARVLAGTAQLVVLDEPSAHLDADTERYVQDAVDRLRGEGRTVLLIAHRPSLVAGADQVVDLSALRQVA
ncbi:MAG TPA: thiol reductant ABC exporter subunit CydD [Angustibacter sp.]|nr:thiol reductant ABC exporter subunit CydD [Angustibacter sp.]